ncbi:hypothetical protein AK812_SmicGene46666, partial [Symbiodinium microadriaticum]
MFHLLGITVEVSEDHPLCAGVAAGGPPRLFAASRTAGPPAGEKAIELEEHLEELL